MKKLVLIVLLISFASTAQNLPKLYNKVNSSVVFIDIESYDYSEVLFSQKVNTEESLGSGVLVGKEGLIWTAAHVIQSAEKITVEFTDGDKYEAEVIASDTNADVALIKVKEGFQLKKKDVAIIADSDKANIGDNVFIIGAPHGFKQSLSRGIISGRFVPEGLSSSFEKVEFLQTDASINPGNSGGPMFNMDGEVIGIASRIYTTSGGFDGIGFAVASNVAKKLLSDVSGSWSGMESLFLTPELAALLNVPQKAGVLVTKISSKGTAAKLGLIGGYIPINVAGQEVLLGGDIILEIAGVRLENQESIYHIKDKLKHIKKGTKVSIVILRHGQQMATQFEK